MSWLRPVETETSRDRDQSRLSKRCWYRDSIETLAKLWGRFSQFTPNSIQFTSVPPYYPNASLFSPIHPNTAHLHQSLPNKTHITKSNPSKFKQIHPTSTQFKPTKWKGEMTRYIFKENSEKTDLFIETMYFMALMILCLDLSSY